jgi:hypothetical protein
MRKRAAMAVGFTGAAAVHSISSCRRQGAAPWPPREKGECYTPVLCVTGLGCSPDVAGGGDDLAAGWVSGMGLLLCMRWVETCAEHLTSLRETSSTQGAVAPAGGSALRCGIGEEKVGGTNERADGLGVGLCSSAWWRAAGVDGVT